MMLLVDTNVIIDFLKNPTEKDLNTIKNAMSCFPRLHMETSDWVGFGELLYKLRKNGVSIPFQDAVISYLVIKNSATVWTRDRHFKLISTVIQDLKLYEEN